VSTQHYEFVRARTCAEALALLNEAGRVSRPLAGGTDLMVQRHKGQVVWERLVDVSQIPELRVIREEGDAIIIGAGVTHSEAAQHPLIRQHLPALAEACHSVGSPQIRNRGTIGGNVANAAACADTLPALICLGATARFITPAGEQELPVGRLVTGVNRTALPAGALIRDFRIPKPPAGARQAFIKIGRRQAQSISRLSLAALGRLDAAGKVAEVRLTPGACTSRTQRFDQAEAILLGQAPSEELVRQAGQAAAAQMVAIAGRRWSTAYKEPALAAIVERALRRIFDLPGEK
jgi:CO/xanthine dehydrogenase FAD-binding subunit